MKQKDFSHCELVWATRTSCVPSGDGGEPNSESREKWPHEGGKLHVWRYILYNACPADLQGVNVEGKGC